MVPVFYPCARRVYLNIPITSRYHYIYLPSPKPKTALFIHHV